MYGHQAVQIFSVVQVLCKMHMDMSRLYRQASTYYYFYCLANQEESLLMVILQYQISSVGGAVSKICTCLSLLIEKAGGNSICKCTFAGALELPI